MTAREALATPEPAAPAAVAPEAPTLEQRTSIAITEEALRNNPSATLTTTAAPAEAPQGEPTREHDNGSARGSPVATTGAAAAPTAVDEALPEAADTPQVDALLFVINEGRGYKTEGPMVNLARRLEADLAAAREREAKLQAAIRDLFRETDWPDGGDLDGFAFQEWAERHGFLRTETRTSFCAEDCACSEYCNGNVGVLGNSGFTCYRKVEWLASPDSAPQQEPQK